MQDFIDEIIAMDYPDQEISHSKSCNCNQCKKMMEMDNELWGSLFDFWNNNKGRLNSQQLASAVSYNNKYKSRIGWARYADDIASKIFKIGYPIDDKTFAQKLAVWQAQNGFTGRNIDGKLGYSTWRRMKPQLRINSSNSSMKNPYSGIGGVIDPGDCVFPSGSRTTRAVVGGKIYSEFLKKRSSGIHIGIDISTSNRGNGKYDLKRGIPVYATLKANIDLATLRTTCVARTQESFRRGLQIQGDGVAKLEYATVKIPQNRGRCYGGYGCSGGNGYGGVVGLACTYSYKKLDGTIGRFNLFIQYLHLILENYLPYYKSGGKPYKMTDRDWRKHPNYQNIGVGPYMKHGATLSAPQLTSGSLLIGYLGSTTWPHVHVQSAYSTQLGEYKRYPRFDPMVMIN